MNEKQAQSRFPDFLGIGTTRGGSSWLHKVLSRHPDIWMPPVKEIHYFDKPQHGVRTIHVFRRRMLLVRLRDYVTRESMQATGDGLMKHLAWDRHFLFTPRGPEWYRRLFRPGPGQITGEITPAYAILDKDAIEAINTANPRIKALYILRNPVDRAWSSIVNNLARKQGRTMVDVPEEEIDQKIDAIAATARSDYVSNIQRWHSVIGEDRLFIGYMEEIKTVPMELLARICSFLSVSLPLPDLEQMMTRPINTTKKHGQGALTDARRYKLARNLMPILEETAALLGGYADQWLADARQVVRRHAPKHPNA